MAPRRSTKALRSARLAKQQALQKKDDAEVVHELACEQDTLQKDIHAAKVEQPSGGEQVSDQHVSDQQVVECQEGTVNALEEAVFDVGVPNVNTEHTEKVDDGRASVIDTVPGVGQTVVKKANPNEGQLTNAPVPVKTDLVAHSDNIMNATDKLAKLGKNNASIINNVNIVSDNDGVLLQRIEKLEKSLATAKTTFATQLEAHRIETEKKFAAMQSWNDVLAQQIQAFSNSRRFHGHKKQMKGWQ
ncbi:hypothetical protein SARC_07978 [Sphaeroforma arctica JP610]|uniref:Uncharacterized protein n=1 Tax=Sphaeroforma arctica JP610 TaxID=667725 RepID=A0A0L0FSU3_9EUKA|nr:hypothetical protein SARC_07978 [Sphaeroforma arctica JP610]KNC79626.1 hypothetical protein SARC_07978 [Sphaeroforma arctica JP610]|eukprot:XP_014153528.1 hypothetical protein SARC_07978 [Sphaeroforma arctica JP610]